MITTRSTDFQSKSDGSACYHGRCYAKKYGVDRFLSLPKSALFKLTICDVGLNLAEAIVKERGKRLRKKRGH